MNTSFQKILCSNFGVIKLVFSDKSDLSCPDVYPEKLRLIMAKSLFMIKMSLNLFDLLLEKLLQQLSLVYRI